VLPAAAATREPVPLFTLVSLGGSTTTAAAVAAADGDSSGPATSLT
jgi:hypothetical protein